MAKESTERDDEMVIDDEPQADEVFAYKITHGVRKQVNALAAELDIAFDIKKGETWRQSEAVGALFDFKNANPTIWRQWVLDEAKRRESERL